MCPGGYGTVLGGCAGRDQRMPVRIRNGAAMPRPRIAMDGVGAKSMKAKPAQKLTCIIGVMVWPCGRVCRP